MAAQDISAKANNDYINQLLKEQEGLNSQYSHAYKLLQQEIDRVRGIENGETQRKDSHVEVHTGKQFRLKVKVHIPVDEHPNFNFVGKLLGPKGSSLQQLQEATQTKMAILGRGSMRDKKKEEELRNQGDPKYSHLNEDLHVEISAYAAPAEAYRRMSSAIGEIQRFLVPESAQPYGPDQDYFEDMRPPQYEGKPKPPFVGDGPPHMAPRGGPPLPPRPMGPPMMGGREPPPRRPAMAQSTYVGEGDEWPAPRPSPRRGGFHGNAAAPVPRAARPYEEQANDYNSYGDSYGEYNSGNAASYYDYGEGDTSYADGYAGNDYEARGPVRSAGGGRGRNASRPQTHPYAGATRRGY